MGLNGTFLLGASGHAKVVLSTLRAAGQEVSGILDDDPAKAGTAVMGVPVTGPIKDLADEPGVRAIISIGDNRARKDVAGRFRHVAWVTAVHPAACVDPTVRLGPGTVVLAGAVVQPDSVLGAHVIVNTGATVDHDCAVGDFAHIAPGAHLAGGVRLGEGALMGIASAAIPMVRIGDWAVVGAGAAVAQDVPAGSVAAGVPARPIKT